MLEAAELLPGAEAVAVSARTGEGLDELRAALDRAAAAAASRAERPGAARLHVDRVFTIKGAGTVVTGTLWSGAIARGDEVADAAPADRRARVRGVQVHDRPLERRGGRPASGAQPDRPERRRGEPRRRRWWAAIGSAADLPGRRRARVRGTRARARPPGPGPPRHPREPGASGLAGRELLAAAARATARPTGRRPARGPPDRPTGHVGGRHGPRRPPAQARPRATCWSLARAASGARRARRAGEWRPTSGAASRTIHPAARLPPDRGARCPRVGAGARAAPARGRIRAAARFRARRRRPGGPARRRPRRARVKGAPLSPGRARRRPPARDRDRLGARGCGDARAATRRARHLAQVRAGAARASRRRAAHAAPGRRARRPAHRPPAAHRRRGHRHGCR